MIEALKLALEALENHEGNYKLGDAGCDRHEAAITAIKEALAQPEPEPEPVACDCNQGQVCHICDPITPSQRTWVGLTDEEIERLIHNFGSDPHTLLDEVDARLKARNT